eukprot:1019721-Rhodomonas_salina.1
MPANKARAFQADSAPQLAANLKTWHSSHSLEIIVGPSLEVVAAGTDQGVFRAGQRRHRRKVCAEVCLPMEGRAVHDEGHFVVLKLSYSDVYERSGEDLGDDLLMLRRGGAGATQVAAGTGLRFEGLFCTGWY